MSGAVGLSGASGPDMRSQAGVEASFPEDAFDRDVLLQLLLHTIAEAQNMGGAVNGRLGMSGDQVEALRRFLDAELGVPVAPDYQPEEEEAMVRTVLMQNRSVPGEIGEWLACIIARRAMEPNHLWEDLGLHERPDLTRLMNRHFTPLAAKNTRNMRWKRFLYRSLCEAEGFTMCPSPTCDACSEFHICYGDDSGEAVLARNNRKAPVV